jgi:hypothetical protein
MRHYQIFPFSADGHLLDAMTADFETDAGAIRRAIDSDFPHGCELWEGFRFVGRFHGAVAQPDALPRPAAPPRMLVH